MLHPEARVNVFPCSKSSLLTQSKNQSSWMACTVIVLMSLRSLLSYSALATMTSLLFLKHTQMVAWPWCLLLFPFVWKTVSSACSGSPDFCIAASLSFSLFQIGTRTLALPLALLFPHSTHHPLTHCACGTCVFVHWCLLCHKDRDFFHLPTAVSLASNTLPSEYWLLNK